MDFKQLESFITIAKYNSFSKASRELYLTQPTLTNHIQNLEKELMTPLFERHGKTIELTQAGRVFHDHAIELIKQRDTALFQINDLIGQFGGSIELPYSTVPGEAIVPQLVADFVKAFPGIRFILHHMDSQDVIEAVTEKKFALGFVGSKPNNDFESIQVYEDDMVFIGPKETPLAQKTLAIEQIFHLPMIIREEGSGSGSIIGRELAKHDLRYRQLNVVAVAESFYMAKKLVELNAGFAFVPRSFAETFTSKDKVLLYEIEDLHSDRQFYFIHHKKATLSPLESQFRQFVIQYFDNER
ncbi:MAG: selenium metabolism-associated LysR family transcriptional regulator [Peptostreptococcaceae bacterium]|nr:selenium metabolism-associated LysR family transcriptional regulator [Peptostreptococcaceae bacterium]